LLANENSASHLSIKTQEEIDKEQGKKFTKNYNHQVGVST
jgi:hypothetical protein